MGLALLVGVLADLKDNDEEGFEYHSGALERLNSFLASSGLPTHREPEATEVWSVDMLGYAGLHDVRRLAAHLDAGRALPPPATEGSTEDACLDAYFALARGQRPSLMRRLLGRTHDFKRGFDHLILHSDAEGYYLPGNFAGVISPPKELGIPGRMVGSVPRLLLEIERIAAALQLPDDLSEQSEELLRFADEPAENGARWQRYGREAYGCVMLREGCRRALAAGAMLVFQ